MEASAHALRTPALSELGRSRLCTLTAGAPPTPSGPGHTNAVDRISDMLFCRKKSALFLPLRQSPGERAAAPPPL